MTRTDPPPKKKSAPPGATAKAIPSGEPDDLLDFETDIFLGDSEPKVTATTRIEERAAEAPDVEITTGESDISLDELELAEGDDPCPSPFERITLAPAVPEKEYVDRMMREAPESDPAPASERVPLGIRPITIPPETVARPALTEELALDSLVDDDPSEDRISGTISTNPSSQITDTVDSLSS